MQRPSALSSLSPQNLSLKNVLHFFLKKPALKKFFIFSGNGKYKIKNPCISGNGSPEKFLIFQEVNFRD